MLKMAGTLARGAERAAASLPLPLRSRGFCCICNEGVGTFLPYRQGSRRYRAPPLMDALGVVGSDVDRFNCPRCLSHDRERHLLLYLRAAGIYSKLGALRILHVAPEARLSKIVAACCPVRYVQGDLFPSAPHLERIDLQQMAFATASFDLVIANHVMEHVDDDSAALREITRVLAPGGRAILQTPFSPVLAGTLQDPGIRSPQARLHAYGQEDHVRLYGSDVFRRFGSAGLEDTHIAHEDVLSHVDAFLHGVNPREPLFLFRKPN
jgi:SAM-dependent methyltransferase